MTNILFISQYLNVGGTETFMMNVLRYIDKKKFHIDFLIFSNERSRYSEEAEKLGAMIYRLPPRYKGWVYYKRLNLFFKAKCHYYKIIHFCGGNVSSIAPLYYAFKYHIPIRIVHAHSSSCDGFHNNILHKINRLFLSVVCTDFLSCSAESSVFFYGNRKSLIVKNGIDTSAYLFDEKRRYEFRKSCNILDTSKVVGHIGRFEVVKNHSFILDVFKRYNCLNKDSLLLLVGDGSLLEEVKKRAFEMGISDNVIFLGERNDIPDILFGMDCFLMPSLYEGLPFVLVEAESSGLPCLISDVINMDVKIIPDVYFLSLKENTKMWADAIKTIIEMDANREEAVSYINKAGFNIIDTLNLLEDIYSRK